jgi:hypothetical protein
VLDPVVTNGNLRCELGRRGRAYVEKHHDAVALARKLRTVYADLLVHRRSRSCQGHALCN